MQHFFVRHITSINIYLGTSDGRGNDSCWDYISSMVVGGGGGR